MEGIQVIITTKRKIKVTGMIPIAALITLSREMARILPQIFSIQRTLSREFDRKVKRARVEFAY